MSAPYLEGQERYSQSKKKNSDKEFPGEETTRKRYDILKESRERSRDDRRARVASGNGREDESSPTSGGRLRKAFAKRSGVLSKAATQSTGHEKRIDDAVW